MNRRPLRLNQRPRAATGCLKLTLLAVSGFGLYGCHSQSVLVAPGESSGAATEALSQEAPELLDVSEFTHEFPSCIFQNGLELTHVFSIRNNARQVVRFTGPYGPSCCGRADLDRYELDPGDTAQLTVTLRANSSPVSAGAWLVGTDCGGQRQLRFTVQARVHSTERMTAVDGAALPVFQLRAGETAKAEIWLERYTEVGTTLDDSPRITSSDPAVTISGTSEFGEPKEIDHQFCRRRWRFDLSMDAGNESGSRTAFLKVSHSDGSTSDHALRWTVESLLDLEPRILVSQSTSESIRRSIRLTSRDGELFEVTALKPSHYGIDAVCETEGRRTNHEVSISIVDPGLCQWRAAQLMIETSRSKQSVLRLPIFLLGAATNENADAERHR